MSCSKQFSTYRQSLTRFVSSNIIRIILQITKKFLKIFQIPSKNVVKSSTVVSLQTVDKLKGNFSTFLEVLLCGINTSANANANTNAKAKFLLLLC